MAKAKKPVPECGLSSVDGLAKLGKVTLDDYVAAVSDYICNEAKANKKAAQIRLSNGLARALVSDLTALVPTMKPHAGEKVLAGALRTAKADVSEFHELDGVRLAVELKPVNLAVGRAVWNRFGDIRAFAVNIHLKFPFAVVGGVLVFPTYEIKRNKKKGTETKSSTVHLIQRVIARLYRAGGRERDSDAAHLLEGIAVVVFDPDTGKVLPDLPAPNRGALRWDEFVRAIARAYDARFGEGIGSDVAAEEEAEAEDESDDSDDPNLE